jgi:hypothetical protein
MGGRRRSGTLVDAVPSAREKEPAPTLAGRAHWRGFSAIGALATKMGGEKSAAPSALACARERTRRPPGATVLSVVYAVSS